MIEVRQTEFQRPCARFKFTRFSWANLHVLKRRLFRCSHLFAVFPLKLRIPAINELQYSFVTRFWLKDTHDGKESTRWVAVDSLSCEHRRYFRLLCHGAEK